MEALHKVFFIQNAIKTPTRFGANLPRFWAQAIFYLLELCYMETLHKVFFIQNAIKKQTKLVAYLLELRYMEALHKVFFIQNAIKTRPNWWLYYWSNAMWKLDIRFFSYKTL